MNNTGKRNYLGLLCSVVLIVAAFMSTFNFKMNLLGVEYSEPLYLKTGYKVLFIGCALAGILFSLIRLDIGVSLSGALSLITFLTVRDKLVNPKAGGELAKKLLDEFIKKSTGYYLILIASIAMIVSGLIYALFVEKD